MLILVWTLIFNLLPLNGESLHDTIYYIVLRFIVLAIHALYIGYVCGAPDLQPETQYFCPNEIGKYTCHDQQILAMDLIAEPYIPAYDPIKFVASTAKLNEGESINHTEYLSARLLNITGRNMTAEMAVVADMTASLRAVTSGLKNRTNITCQTFKIVNEVLSVSRSTSTIYIAS